LIPDGSKLSNHKIVEASVSGKKLLLKIGDENSSDAFPLEFTLTGADQAEGRIVVASDSGTPPPKKPWHFERIGQ